MINTYQRHWFTMVRRSNSDGMLDAQTIYRGTDSECAAVLRVATDTFKIAAAAWESYAPELKTVDVDGLRGEEAYFECGPVLKEALSELGNFPRSLFAETVRGIIQAETFLLAERGFVSPVEYSDYWEKFYAGSCRYYSNLDRITKKWYEYCDNIRTTNLFNRFKAQNLYTVTGKGYHITGMFSDSFHELSVDLDIDSNMKITKAIGVLLRAPDDVCCEAAEYMHRLPGNVVGDLGKKQVAGLLGANEGCIHMIDLVYDALETVQIYRQKGVGKK